MTEGLIQTGGAGKYLQMYISGLPPLKGSIPNNSQSDGVICLNKFNVFNGLKSSVILFAYFSNSGLRINTCSISLSHSSFSGVSFFPIHLNVSWTILSAAGPAPLAAFFTTPLTWLHFKHLLCFLHWSETFFKIFILFKLSISGFRSSFRNWRLFFSSKSTAAQFLHMHCKTVMMALKYPTWKTGNASLIWPKWPWHEARFPWQVEHSCAFDDVPIRGSKAPPALAVLPFSKS